MNYKELFTRLYTLLTSPKRAWTEITVESPRRDVMATFVYPLIALEGLVVLLSAFIHEGLKRDVYQPALMEMLSCCIALFGGFFLASYLLDMLSQKYLGRSADMPLAQLFVGYAMGAVFVADVLVVLFPQFFIFKWVLLFYVCYIVWEGSEVIWGVDEDKRLVFMAIASAAIVFSPVIIRMVFNTLSNLLG